MILEYKIAKPSHISEAWSWFCSIAGENSLRRKLHERRMGDVEAEGKIQEIMNLLMEYGKFTPPSTPPVEYEKLKTRDESKEDVRPAKQPKGQTRRSPAPVLQNPTPRASPSPSDDTSSPSTDRSGPFSSPMSAAEKSDQQRQSTRGRGRGRGKGRGKGRGRGRGN